jgi:hypothetical protein
MKTNRIGGEDNTKSELFQQILARASQKCPVERRIEGVIKRLMDNDFPEEELAFSEIKDAVRAVFPHLTFTDARLDKLLLEALERKEENNKSGRGWISVNAAAQIVKEMKILAKASDMTFRLFCEHALLCARMQFRKQLGLNRAEITKLTSRKIDSLAERSRLLRDRAGCGLSHNPERN